MDACAQCGMVGFHRAGCGLGQVSAPLNRIDKGIGAVAAGQTAGFNAVTRQLQEGNVIALANLHVQSKQLEQLQHINEQMGAVVAMQHAQLKLQQQQVLEQQRQAALQQVLFEGEQYVNRVNEVARRDSFAAAVMAALRLEGFAEAHISPEDFAAIEHKRSFQGVLNSLNAKWSQVGGNNVERAKAVVRAFVEFVHLTRALGDVTRLVDPNAILAEAKKRVETATRNANIGLAMTIAAPVLTLLGLWLVVRAFQKTDGLLVAVLVLAAGPVCWKYGRPFYRRAQQRRTYAEAIAKAADNYKAFMERADGGPLLSATIGEHPALNS